MVTIMIVKHVAVHLFRGDLFVTIAEIHTLILEVCVCLHITVFRSFFIVI